MPYLAACQPPGFQWRALCQSLACLLNLTAPYHTCSIAAAQKFAGHCPEVIRCYRIHVEPGSDLLFMENLVFTICYGGQVKGWERLKPQPIPSEPPALEAPALPQSVQDKPAQPSHFQQGAARPAPARLPVSRNHEARRIPEHAAPRQHPPGDPGLQSICTPPPQRLAEKHSL